RLAQAIRVDQDRLEHGPDVGRGARDDAQDVRHRGLPFERLGQLAIARLELVEEPHVLDRDHGLVREGLEERDLTLREWSRFGPPDSEDPEHSPLAQHRYEDATAPPHRSGELVELVFLVELDVGDVDDTALEDCPARSRSPAWRDRAHAPDDLERSR